MFLKVNEYLYVPDDASKVSVVLRSFFRQHRGACEVNVSHKTRYYTIVTLFYICFKFFKFSKICIIEFLIINFISTNYRVLLSRLIERLINEFEDSL